MVPPPMYLPFPFLYKSSCSLHSPPLKRAFGKSSTVLSYTVAKSRNPKDLRTLKNQ